MTLKHSMIFFINIFIFFICCKINTAHSPQERTNYRRMAALDKEYGFDPQESSRRIAKLDKEYDFDSEENHRRMAELDKEYGFNSKSIKNTQKCAQFITERFTKLEANLKKTKEELEGINQQIAFDQTQKHAEYKSNVAFMQKTEKIIETQKTIDTTFLGAMTLARFCNEQELAHGLRLMHQSATQCHTGILNIMQGGSLNTVFGVLAIANSIENIINGFASSFDVAERLDDLESSILEAIQTAVKILVEHLRIHTSAIISEVKDVKQLVGHTRGEMILSFLEMKQSGLHIREDLQALRQLIIHQNTENLIHQQNQKQIMYHDKLCEYLTAFPIAQIDKKYDKFKKLIKRKDDPTTVIDIINTYHYFTTSLACDVRLTGSDYVQQTDNFADGLKIVDIATASRNFKALIAAHIQNGHSVEPFLNIQTIQNPFILNKCVVQLFQLLEDCRRINSICICKQQRNEFMHTIFR